MKNLKLKRTVQISIGLLAFLMLIKSLMMPFVYLDFKLNQEYISKVLCINRDEPQLQCNGKCVLMQKMKEAHDQTQSQDDQTPTKQFLETFCEPIADFTLFPDFFKKQEIAQYQTHLFSSYSGAIFHPPQA